MTEGYDRHYRKFHHFFGSEPEDILVEYHGKFPPGLTVLDIGCGDGRNLIPLAQWGFSVVGIDPSEVAVEKTRNQLTAYPRKAVHHTSFENFHPVDDEVFGAIIILGLIPILDPAHIRKLISFVGKYTDRDSLVFVTAFRTDDDSFVRNRKTGEPLGVNSFRLPDGRIRTYLEPDEILTLFPGFTSLHHREGPGPLHRHGDSPPERHMMIKWVGVKS